jgi:hypothetical protein
LLRGLGLVSRIILLVNFANGCFLCKIKATGFGFALKLGVLPNTREVFVQGHATDKSAPVLD